jgi:hypothetical protein
MRLLATLALAVLCALVPVAAAAASGADVIDDCTKHGTLTKHYSQKDYRQALSSLPADVDEYGDCRNVIHDAQVAGAANASNGGKKGGGSTAAAPSDFNQPPPSGGAGAPTTTTSSGGHHGSTTQPASQGDDPTAVNPANNGADNPATTDENQALIDATRNGGGAVQVGNDAIQPGAQNSSFAQGLPAPVLGVLSLLGVAALAVGALALRRKLRGSDGAADS